MKRKTFKQHWQTEVIDEGLLDRAGAKLSGAYAGAKQLGKNIIGPTTGNVKQTAKQQTYSTVVDKFINDTKNLYNDLVTNLEKYPDWGDRYPEYWQMVNDIYEGIQNLHTVDQEEAPQAPSENPAKSSAKEQPAKEPLKLATRPTTAPATPPAANLRTNVPPAIPR